MGIKNVIVIAPHADDEILGCGATMAKHIENGDKVIVVVCTNAAKGAPEFFSEERVKKVRSEALKAHKFLGIAETIFLDFPAPALNSFPEYKISNELLEIFKLKQPNYLYLPHPGDMHQDHKAVYRASLVAARPNAELKIDHIFCYETLSETNWTPMHEVPFVPNRYVDVTNYMDKKIKAMSFFTTQVKNWPNSRSLEALISLSKYRGATIEVEHAESFFVERQIVL